MPNRFRPSAALLLTLGFLLASVPASAESARDILDKARAAYEKRLAGIETVTIVQEVMGMETTTQLRKTMVDGHPALVSSGEGPAGDAMSFYDQFDELAKDATVKGTEKVDGKACWVIHSTNLQTTQLSAEGADDFEATDGLFYIDRDDLFLRRMVVNGTAKNDGVPTPITMEMQFADYREVDGWLQPFRMEMSLGGQDGGETPEMAEAREGLAKMKEELAKMPADQRQMVEKMMKGQMAQLESMVASDRLAITVTVKEVRVNDE